MTGATCPKEGCDYGEREERSIGSVKSHINASKDHDDKAALRAQVEEQAAEDRAEQASEPATEPAAEEDDDESEPEADEGPNEQAESGESEQAEEQAETPEEMATEEEYQEQQAQVEEQGETEGAESSPTDGEKAAAAAAGGAGLMSTFSDRSPLFWVGVALLALLVLSMAMDSGGSGDAEQATPSTEQATDPPSTPTEAAQRGGLNE